MTRQSKVALFLCLPGALVLVLVLLWTRTRESLNERAVRLCHECGLADPEINQLIKTTRTAPGTRAVKLEAFYATFPDRAEAAPCLPCAEAVLDAAAK